MIDLVEYQSREYCRDIGCEIQDIIEEGDVFAIGKSFCQRDCEAYNLHKWLQENNYKIVKDLGEDIATLYEVINILYDFDEYTAERGFKVLEKFKNVFELEDDE